MFPCPRRSALVLLGALTLALWSAGIPVDYQKLLDDINAGLQAFVQEELTFPVAEELPPIAPSPPAPFLLKDVQPPSQLYLTIDHRVTVSIVSSNTNQNTRWVFTVANRDGEVKAMSFDVLTGTPGVTTSQTLYLGEGWLLSVIGRAVGQAPTLGKVYAHVLLVGQGSL